ncbi:MAG: RT0821/Lpp0805 family surface protein [Hyphomicrobiaceae bacterium]
MHNTRRMITGSLVIALATSLAACGPNGPNKADTGTVVGAVAGGLLGNTVGKGSGKVLATVAGAFVGGVVGNSIGRSLDEQDRILAQQAEYAALERGQSGVAKVWRNPDNGRYGEVIPSRPYRRGSNDCRDFTHKVYIDGQPQAMRGTACRNPDGTWRNVG